MDYRLYTPHCQTTAQSVYIVKSLKKKSLNKPLYQIHNLYVTIPIQVTKVKKEEVGYNTRLNKHKQRSGFIFFF